MLAFLAGVWLGSWSWLLGAPLGVMLAAVAAYLYYREPTGHDAGAVFLLPLGVAYAGPAFFVAAVGVVCGRSARRYLGRSRGRPRTGRPGEPPPLGAAADEGSADEPTGRTR